MKALSLILLTIITCLNFAKGQVVTLDYYFNHEVHKSATGKIARYHYMWTDSANTGFSKLGDVFKKNGAQLKSLEVAPTVANLKKSGIYIIVDPDTKKESVNPNYIKANNISEIAKWVHHGGVLLMLANDSANVELIHFNNLARLFGIHFNDDLQNHVVDTKHLEDGAVYPLNNVILKTAKKIFLKDVCSISIKAGAQSALKNKNGATIIATANYGKGIIMAIGDPWLYNEYLNGNLPEDYENDKAADDVVKWLIKNIPSKK